MDGMIELTLTKRMVEILVSDYEYKAHQMFNMTGRDAFKMGIESKEIADKLKQFLPED